MDTDRTRVVQNPDEQGFAVACVLTKYNGTGKLEIALNLQIVNAVSEREAHSRAIRSAMENNPGRNLRMCSSLKIETPDTIAKELNEWMETPKGRRIMNRFKSSITGVYQNEGSIPIHSLGTE